MHSARVSRMFARLAAPLLPLRLAVCFGVGLSVGAPAMAHADGPSAQDVMNRNDAARKTNDLTANATLTVGEDGSESHTKSFSMTRKLGSDGQHSMSLTRFSAPAEVRGEGILFLEGRDATNDVQLYLPRFKKIRRVEASSQSSSFMGSAFSYSDMTAAQPGDYRHSMLRQEACPTAPTVTCFVVESTPTAQGAIDRSAYSKAVNWIRSDNYLVSQTECYARDGSLWKRVRATDVQEVDAATHKYMALTVRVDDLKAKRFSILAFHDVKVNSGVSDSTFTPQNLSRE